jgi:hypothetical protein
MVLSRARVVAAVGAATAMVAAAGGAAFAASGPATVAIGHSHAVSGHGRFTVKQFNMPVRGLSSAKAAASLAAAPATVPLWSSSIKVGSKTFKYEMVGKNPFVKQKVQSVNIKAPIVPVVFTFQGGNQGGNFNPAKASCGEKRTDTALVNQSPVFTKLNYTFQRAEFWKFVGGSKHLNPNYGVNLVSKVLPVTKSQQVSVPPGIGQVISSGCGALGLIDLIDWDNFVQTKLIPQLRAKKLLGPTTIPIILFRNVAMFDQHNPNDCCALGYHSGFVKKGNGAQFYTVTDIDDSNQFKGVLDVSDLAHEVGEWMDDPTGVNPTPAWGHIGQVTGCQGNLEVGDPLTGTNLAVKAANGVTYHPQELAFFSWFYRQKPSIGVNGFYSLAGTFKSPSKPCS